MRNLLEEIGSFSRRKEAETAQARQLVAFRLIAGIDLDAALAAKPPEKAVAVRRIERLLERERCRGLRRHWSYDLNRHIALKQALDRLRDAERKRDEGTAIAAREARRAARAGARQPSSRGGPGGR